MENSGAYYSPLRCGSLFVMQGNDWIDAHCAAGWNPAAHDCSETQDRTGKGERGWICRRDLDQKSSKHARHDERACKPEGQADSEMAHPLHEDEPKDIRCGCAHRHTNSEFLCSLTDGMRNDRIQPDGR